MSEESTVGKKYKGQRFVPNKTEAEAKEEAAKRIEYADPNAVELDVYLTIVGKSGDVVLKAMMESWPKAKGIKRATKEKWDTIFEGF